MRDILISFSMRSLLRLAFIKIGLFSCLPTKYFADKCHLPQAKGLMSLNAWFRARFALNIGNEIDSQMTLIRNLWICRPNTQTLCTIRDLKERPMAPRLALHNLFDLETRQGL